MNEADNPKAKYSRSSIMLDNVKTAKELNSDFRRNFNGVGWKRQAMLIARHITPPIIWPVLEKLEKAASKEQ